MGRGEAKRQKKREIKASRQSKTLRTLQDVVTNREIMIARKLKGILDIQPVDILGNDRSSG